jgi:hypothetical protein
MKLFTQALLTSVDNESVKNSQNQTDFENYKKVGAPIIHINEYT